MVIARNIQMKIAKTMFYNNHKCHMDSIIKCQIKMRAFLKTKSNTQ